MLGMNNNQSNDTVLFCIKAKGKNGWNFMNRQSKSKEPTFQKLLLLSKTSESFFFKNMPKTFIITTKNNSCYFNLEMLKDTSPVIADFVLNNPKDNQYNLNINDEENVLTKFEQLYQGNTVFFDEDEIPTSQRITKLLQIKNCPYYLKPASLYVSNEIDSEGNTVFCSKDCSNIDLGVKYYKDYFINFLRKPDFQTFTIFTNKNQYKCNTIGVYSSKVIRSILTKDPTKNEFKFEFDDENDEFQLICDLFNFNEVDIKSDNMDILKKFSEDLEIECMIGQIDNFINYYEKVSQKIDEQQKIIDSIDVLYDMLYEIRQHGIEKVCIFINQSKWSQTVENVQELAAFILQVIKPSPSLHKEMIDLLIRLNNDTNSNNQLNILLPFIINRLMTFYMPKKRQQENKKFTKPPNNHYNDSNKKSVNETINLNNRYVYPFIRLLYKRGLISKEEIIEKVKNYDLSVHFLNVFFLPEIIEVNPNILEDDQPFSISNSNRISESKYFIDFYKKYFLEKIDLYEKMLDNFEPEDDLTKSILHDDVDTLQLIITRNEIDIKKKLVPYNVFDDIKGKMSLLNYASYCGSLKCFKYLFLNQGIIDNNTFYYAICGGNNEIIRIVNKESINIDTTSTNNIQNSLFSAKTFWFPNIGNPIFGNTKANPDNILQYTINKKDQSITVLNCCNINNIIAPTIALHKNDLFDWIFENKFISQGKFGESLEKIALL